MKNSLQFIKTRMDVMKNDPTTRPKRYDNIDGTVDMFFGLMILSFALLDYLETILPEHSIWRTNSLAGLLFMYLVLGPMLALGFLVRKLIKRHVTWPRTGYVALGLPGTGGQTKPLTGPAAKANRLLWLGRLYILIAFAVVTGLIGAAVALFWLYVKRHPEMPDLTALGHVFYLAYWVPLYALSVRLMGRGHAWKWLLVAFMAAGLTVIGLSAPHHFSGLSRPTMLFVGLVWVGSGVITFFLYLRHNPRHAPEME